MNKKIIFPLVIISVIISGCTTQSIKQGKDLSTSGIAYTVAVDNLIGTSIDTVIDFDSAELKKSRIGSKSDLMDIITCKNKALIKILKEFSAFRAQTKLLKAYYINLQALADSSIKDDAGEAVKSLSDSTIHAAKIKRALKRDAEVVGEYMALQENQLKKITAMLKDRYAAENDLFLNKNVIVPYVDVNKPLPENWSKDRKKWAKTQFMNQQLATGNEAAKQLRGVWGDILQGKTDINYSLSVLISDVNQFVVTVQALQVENKAANESE